MAKVRVGVVGCGDVAMYVYLPTLRSASDLADIAAVCDLDPNRARQAGDQFGVSHVYTDVDRFLAEAPIDAVLTLTPMPYHFQVSLGALHAGKHVYTEKTLALTLEEADRLVDEANNRHLIFASAPAMGVNPVNLLARRLIQEGAIGRVCNVVGHAAHAGPARAGYFAWYQAALADAGLSAAAFASTDPTWFYQPGAGPLFDMGVYALATLTTVIGPVRRVTALSGRQVPELEIEGGVAKGKKISVGVDDSTLMLLDFGDQTFATVDASYNVLGSRGPAIQIYGSEGTIAMSPQSRQEPMLELLSRRSGVEGWQQPEVPGPQWHLGSGILHFLECVQTGEKPVISGEHARHVFEIMVRAYEAARTGQTQTVVRSF